MSTGEFEVMYLLEATAVQAGQLRRDLGRTGDSGGGGGARMRQCGTRGVGVDVDLVEAHPQGVRGAGGAPGAAAAARSR